MAGSRCECNIFLRFIDVYAVQGKARVGGIMGGRGGNRRGVQIGKNGHACTLSHFSRV